MAGDEKCDCVTTACLGNGSGKRRTGNFSVGPLSPSNHPGMTLDSECLVEKKTIMWQKTANPLAMQKSLTQGRIELTTHVKTSKNGVSHHN
tara:strand:- start:1529 stop:1801 length:273 start_codon:yes stop_codon:yes gene_type:complete